MPLAAISVISSRQTCFIFVRGKTSHVSAGKKKVSGQPFRQKQQTHPGYVCENKEKNQEILVVWLKKCNCGEHFWSARKKKQQFRAIVFHGLGENEKGG